MAKKNYLLDTSVYLTDGDSIFQFDNNDIFVPLKVLEEIDKHKKRQDSVGANARRIIRILDELRNNGDLQKGVRLGKGKGIVRVMSYDCLSGSIFPPDLDIRIPDHIILATAKAVHIEYPSRKLIVVSRDINMRVICDSIGLKAEDYKTERAANSSDELYTGFIEHLVDDQVIERFYNDEEIYIEKDEIKNLWYPNQYVMMVSNANEKKSALARFYNHHTPLKKVINGKLPDWKINARNKEQAFAIDMLLDPNIKLISLIGRAGSGKAQPLDSKILTPTGWRKMCDMKVDMLVIGRDGRPTNVIGVYPQGQKDIYRITFSDGTSTEACGEHLWHTRTDKDRKYNKPGSVKNTEEIKNTLRVRKTRKNHSIPIVMPIEFEQKERLPIDPYLLGSLLGDGCISVGSPTFSSKDKENVKVLSLILSKIDCKINKIPNSNCDYRITKRRGGYGGSPSRRVLATKIDTGEKLMFESVKQIRESKEFCYPSVHRVIVGKYKQYKGYNWKYLDQDKVSNNPLKDLLIKEGLWGKKSENKFIPDKYKFANINNRLSLLRGLMDTDGYVSKTGKQPTYCSISKDLADGVAFLVRSLGGKAVITSRYTSYTHKGKKHIGQKSYRVRISLGSLHNPFLLHRKASRWLPNKETSLRKYIDTIELVGKKDAQCIMVDNKEHLYITDDCIVTHNTLMAIAAGLQQTIGLRKEFNNYDRLIVSRPVQPLGKDIGFLPGTMEEKMLPWLMPIQDNLKYLMGDKTSLEMYMEKGKIEIEAITYIRGRSITNAFVIIDEAQNLTKHEIKTIITRIGEGTKIILTGDIEQIDNIYVNETSNGLAHAIESFKQYPIAGHVTFRKGERSEIATIASKVL